MKRLILTAIIISLSFILFGCDKKEIRRDLVAFTNGSSISGSFFLGIGSIEGVPVYKYLYKENGGIRQDYYYAKHSIVYETDETKNSYVTFTYLGWGCGEISNINCIRNPIFYIPRGSINYQFSLDLNNR